MAETWPTCDRCGKHLTEQVWTGSELICEECWNAREGAANRRFDEEEARKKNERFDAFARSLREVYPTRIPEEWLR